MSTVDAKSLGFFLYAFIYQRNWSPGRVWEWKCKLKISGLTVKSEKKKIKIKGWVISGDNRQFLFCGWFGSKGQMGSLGRGGAPSLGSSLLQRETEVRW